MTREDDFIGQLEGYLDEFEGMTPLPPMVRDAVRAELPRTRQIGSIPGPMRYLRVSKPVQFAIAAAAVVVIAVLALQFFGNSNVGAPPATTTPEPTAMSTGTPEPTAGGLRLGPFALTDAGGTFDVAMTVTISATDWHGAVGSGVLVKNDNPDAPDGAGLIVFTGQLEVYGDACHWATTRPDPMTGATADEVIAALAAQVGRNATEPVDVTVDGYAGKSITLHVPDDAAYAGGQFSECDQGYFGSWAWGSDPTPSRYHQGPGQIDQVWVVDVNGTLVTIDAAWYEGTPADVRAELDAILGSFQFG
jgi:hypothetical protein